jgi:hypothetical protein
VKFEKSLKGWGLYSWPEGNNWNYSILIRTNRLKSYEEVIKNDYFVTGTDSLKLLLRKLPEIKNILWISEVWLEGMGYRLP